MVRAQNEATTGRPSGQGNDCNWSNNFRRALDTLIASFIGFLDWCHKAGVPSEVVAACTARAWQTLCVESFFPILRDSKNSGGGNPYAAVCAQYREAVLLEKAKQSSDVGFDYYTGPSRGYPDAASKPVAFVHKPKRAHARKWLSDDRRNTEQAKSAREAAKSARAAETANYKVLCDAARLMRGSRTTRVTDKGKHNVGAAPTQLRLGFHGKSGPEVGDLGTSSLTGRVNLAQKQKIVYFAQSILVVKASRGQGVSFFLALLLEHVYQTKTSIASSKRKQTRAAQC